MLSLVTFDGISDLWLKITKNIYCCPTWGIIIKYIKFNNLLLINFPLKKRISLDSLIGLKKANRSYGCSNKVYVIMILS